MKKIIGWIVVVALGLFALSVPIYVFKWYSLLIFAGMFLISFFLNVCFKWISE
jgi:hypothetical protein